MVNVHASGGENDGRSATRWRYSVKMCAVTIAVTVLTNSMETSDLRDPRDVVTGWRNMRSGWRARRSNAGWMVVRSAWWKRSDLNRPWRFRI